MSHPKKATIARALGITPAAFTKYVRRGCPVYSVEAALTWQRQNVDPAQRLAQRRRVAAKDSRPARRDGVDACIEQALHAGEQAGRRDVLEWLWRQPEIGAAALVRHAGQDPAEALRLAFTVLAALHAYGIELYELTDEELGETFAGCWRGDLAALRAELPDWQALETRVAELAETLWPPG